MFTKSHKNDKESSSECVVASCFKACTKTRNNKTKPPKRNERNRRNDRNETAETSETKQNHRNKQNPLPLLRANCKQANLSDIQANRSAIQANRSVPCTQVSLNSTPVSLNIVQGPVVQSLDSAIHWINHYPVDKCWQNKLRYPLDSDLSGG